MKRSTHKGYARQLAQIRRANAREAQHCVVVFEHMGDTVGPFSSHADAKAWYEANDLTHAEGQPDIIPLVPVN